MRVEMQTASYVDGASQEEYLEYLRCRQPDLFSLLSVERCADAAGHVKALNSASWEFEDTTSGGRGTAYNVAQRVTTNRRVGMLALLKCFGSARELPPPDYKILDVLGGDGALARFCKTLGRRAPTVYTADISKFMIDACQAQALPCLRQSATRSLFNDDVLDGVLVAYGSHHLDSGARQLAVREAHRTLKAGGRLVLHDFEIGGRCAKWFDSIVHPFSRTGHAHEHFSRREMHELFMTAGFRDVRILEIRDPFTLHGNSPEEARHNAIMHTYGMYDLIKIADSVADIAPRLERLITETLGPIAIQRDQGRFLAEVPRQALIAIGTKAEKQ
jgi:SAM-dependent methyltransferase